MIANVNVSINMQFSRGKEVKYWHKENFTELQAIGSSPIDRSNDKVKCRRLLFIGINDFQIAI